MSQSMTSTPSRARPRRRPALFDGYVTDLVTGERRRLRQGELTELWRLWRKHADIRTGAARWLQREKEALR